MNVDVSIIIPVLNDAAVLARCLESLKAFANGPVTYEVIVVDGGSSDDSVRVAKDFGIEALVTERGRAKQMNAGAARAKGKWLWFLHADCVPDGSSLRAIGSLSQAAWGCFCHIIEGDPSLLRVIEAADNIRARRLHLPYGDQGVFVRRDVFEHCRGFDDVPFLEDVMLARRLRKLGAPVVLAPPLRSDARRWQQRGVLQTTLLNWRILWEFSVLGRSPEDLRRMYVTS